METLFQAAIEFEAIAGRGDQRSLDEVGAFAMGILGNETDAVAHLKPCGVGQGDLLIPIIAIHDKFSADGRLFEEDRVYPAPQNADFRLKEDRVAQSVCAWQNADRAASTPRDV